MKEIRKSALNWALVAFGVTLLIGVTGNLFGHIPAVTEGGYPILVLWGFNLEAVLVFAPRISPWFWLFVIPFSVFAFRYLSEYLKVEFSANWGFEFAMYLGIFFGLVLAVVSFEDVTFNGTLAKLYLSVFLAIITMISLIILRGFADDGEIAVAIQGTITGTICAAMQFLIHGIFGSPNHIEWIIGTIFGIVPILLAVGSLLSSIIPLLHAVEERFLSREFWKGLRRAGLYLLRTIVPNGAEAT